MSDLTEFLLARIAEDEAVARAVVGNRDAREAARGPDFMVEQTYDPWPLVTVGAERVLAECEAKRRIVDAHLHHESIAEAYRSPRWTDGMNDNDRVEHRKAEARFAATEGVLRLLALPYTDNPDYRDEWRVSP